MQLGVREAASLMNVSEKTIYRWIKQDKLPAFKMNEQYRFNRAELLEWATAQRVNVSADIFREQESEKVAIPGLGDALKAGGIHYRVGGADKTDVLKTAVDLMSLPEEVDKTFLLRVLMARETLGSTGIGNGVAIPHVRNPIVLYIPRPVVMLCFLEKAVDFDALDGKPVHTIFMMVSPTISAHLSLLARLSFALRQPEFGGVVARQGTREEILEIAAKVDGKVSAQHDSGSGEGETKP